MSENCLETYVEKELYSLIRNEPEVATKYIEVMHEEALEYERLREETIERLSNGDLNLFPVTEELQDDKVVVMMAVRERGEDLCAASERLQDDEEVVMTALEQSYKALKWASHRFQDDDMLVLKLVKEHAEALPLASHRLNFTYAFLIECINENKEVVKNINPRVLLYFQSNYHYLGGEPDYNYHYFSEARERSFVVGEED